MSTNEASQDSRDSFQAVPAGPRGRPFARARRAPKLLGLLIVPLVLRLGGCCLPGDPSCDAPPPNADASGRWEFFASMPGDMGAVEWILELSMSPDGQITGVAPLGRITLIMDTEFGNSVQMVRDQKAVSGQVRGDKIELRFDAFHTGNGNVTYKGRFLGPNELGGDDWMAERF